MHISDELLRKLKEERFDAEKQFNEVAGTEYESSYDARNLTTLEEAEKEDAKGNFADFGDVDPNISIGITRCLRIYNAETKWRIHDTIVDFIEVNNTENLNDKSHYIKRIEELTDYVEKYKKEAKEIIDLEQELIGKCDNLMDILDKMRNGYGDE